MAKEINWRFNDPEAKGRVKITRNYYGVEIAVNGKHVLLVDLYHLSQPGKFAQVVVYHPDDSESEPTLHIRQDAEGNVTVIPNRQHNVTWAGWTPASAEDTAKRKQLSPSAQGA